MEGYCSTGQSPQWAVVPMEEEEEADRSHIKTTSLTSSSVANLCPRKASFSGLDT